MYTKNPASGYRNIKLTQQGTFSVTVKDDYIGTFKDINYALKIRDEERKKRRMKPLGDEYASNSITTNCKSKPLTKEVAVNFYGC